MASLTSRVMRSASRSSTWLPSGGMMASSSSASSSSYAAQIVTIVTSSPCCAPRVRVTSVPSCGAASSRISSYNQSRWFATNTADERDASEKITMLAKRMRIQEARMILAVEETATLDEIEERFQKLFKANEVDAGGSFYLQSKIYRAKQRLDDETADKDAIQAASLKWAESQKEGTTAAPAAAPSDDAVAKDAKSAPKDAKPATSAAK